MKGIDEFLLRYYGINLISYKKYSTGAGSDTYFIKAKQGQFILKKPCESEMNNPYLEPQLCKYLLEKGLPVSRFIVNKEGQYITKYEESTYQLKAYIEGNVYELNKAPSWLMQEMAAMLGKIHRELKDYTLLPEGIGENFFKYMTPDVALESYKNSLDRDREMYHGAFGEDLKYRINQMKTFAYKDVDFSTLSYGNTHGDYMISQVIVGEGKLQGVIDWTTACTHPYVWEIIRSFVYAEPSCAEGEIDVNKLIDYVDEYLKYNELTKQDLVMMPVLFYYQIAVCDYYGQYFNSDADNRDIYLHQAIFSTKLMRFFEKNITQMMNQLSQYYKSMDN